MTPEERARLEYLEGIVTRFMLQDRYYAEKNLQFADGRNIVLGGTTGTKIGTATTGKLSFFNATPVVRQATINAPTSNGGTYNQSDVNSIVTAVNNVISTLRTYGLIA